MVIAVIGLLAALLFPVLATAKARGRSAVCINHLTQTGRALQMYVSDHNRYPPALGGPPFQTWADRLTAYNSLNWTNRSWNCPSYIANKGMVKFTAPPSEGGKFVAWTSYSYNAFGMSGFQISGSHIFGKPWLGLGDLDLTVQEQQIVSPSEMYAVADARPIWLKDAGGFAGREEMNPWKYLFGFAEFTEASPPHSEGYNMLFNDAHVTLVKQKDYLYPPRTAHNWNRDNQPHPELWSAKSQWVIQN